MGVHCRLSTLLGEKRMKQAELVRLTGLAKGTVTALYHDRVGKVDYAVLGRICRVLDCRPGDLLVYVPDELDK